MDPRLSFNEVPDIYDEIRPSYPPAMPDSRERRRDEFAVRMSVARTELALQGYTAEAESMIRDALERADSTGDDRARFPGLRSLGHVHMMRSK